MTSGEMEICSILDGIIGSKKDLPPVKLKQAALCVINGRYSGRGKIFTDASKENSSCGIGVYVETTHWKYSYKLKWNISITAAELQAIKVAMDIVETNHLHRYVIFTDSMTACRMLEDAVETRKAEKLLVEILNIARKWRISIQWIPSHVGISGNEMADQLARAGLDHPTVLDHNLFLKDVFELLKLHMREKTTRWYKQYSEEKGKTFF